MKQATPENWLYELECSTAWYIMQLCPWSKKIKALSYDRKLYLDRHARNPAHARQKRYFKAVSDSPEKDEANAGAPSWMAPAVFTLEGENRTLFLISLVKLRHKIAVLGEDVILDFSATEKLFADGMLLFYAELKRLIRHTHGRIDIRCTVPHNSKVAQVLKQLGVLDLLGVKNQVLPVDHDVVHWRAASGQLVVGSKYDEILMEYDGEITEALQSNLYTGITEAMTNVLNHAYDLPREDRCEFEEDAKNWWMFSHQKDEVLSVVFCDLGAGIPRTLPLKRRSVWNRLRRKNLGSDAEIIKFAVKDSVSRTRKSHRGKGLRQIVEVVRGIVGAEAVIYSNGGSLHVRSGGSTKALDYNDSILGTLIFWRIPLHDKEEA
jgi:hypothetical protein